MTETVPGVPTADRRPSRLELHGSTRVDDYAWLRNVDDEDVLEHLRAERAFYDAATAHLGPLVRTLTDEMSRRVPPSEMSVRWRRDTFSYYMRTPAGSEYAQLVRSFEHPDPHPATKSVADDSLYERFSSPDQILLDPATLAEGSAYVELGVSLVSPDERVLAYSVDRTGDEVYELCFRDLESGADLPDLLPRTYYGGAWSADSSTFFYTVHDEKYRPFQVRRHRLGSSPDTDVVVLEEPDERFELSVRTCRSGDVVVISAESRDTSEVWLVDAHEPDSDPWLVEPRRSGVEYSCEHARTDDGDVLYVVTNDQAVEFRLMVAPLKEPGRANWREVVPEDPSRRLHSVDAFDGWLVLTYRALSSVVLQVISLNGGPSYDLTPAPDQGTIRLEHNELYATSEITIAQESYTEPVAWYSVDLATGERRLLHRHDVPTYDAQRYVCERRTFLADDGVEVPVTLVRRRDVPLDGTAPCLMYGYGAYEAIDEPEFHAALSVLLDHGVVYAHAHVRGGGEGGRGWWLGGRMATKQNTFGDHIAVARGLGQGVVDASRIVTRGLSAGGLLQGAVFTQEPGLWAGVVAEVPFVDVVNTMLDSSIPLTVNEWEEWGDPRKAEEYAWLMGYSPYDNIPAAGGRPPLLATGALHDPRVMVWEPAKWVAALRASDPAWAGECLFRCETGAGAHVGPSGRFAHLRYEAEIYAWVLDRLGLAVSPPVPGSAAG